jgi:hypothetical protein
VTVGKVLGKGDQCRTTTATDIKRLDTTFEALGNPLDQWQDNIGKLSCDGLAAILRHDLVEAGIVAIAQPSPLSKQARIVSWTAPMSAMC